MSLARLWVIARLELMQRVRTVSWYVLLGVFGLLLIGVTVLAFLAFGGLSNVAEEQRGAGIYSTIVVVTLLLVLLVSPTLSGNSINGDRDAATLAAVQVTRARTGEILLGKVLAAWITGLAFVAVAAPFLVVAIVLGSVDPIMIVISIALLVAEIGIVSAIGVGLSGLLARPLFSVATTYLVVAALSVGTLIGFGLGGTAFSSETTIRERSTTYDATGSIDDDAPCGEWVEYTSTTPRFDRVWWMLAANPFVILADATPTAYSEYGYPDDVFGTIKSGVRFAQLTPDLEIEWDYCRGMGFEESRTAQEVEASTAPSWFVGLGVQLVLAGLLLGGAWGRTRTPARRLPPGTRIA